MPFPLLAAVLPFLGAAGTAVAEGAAAAVPAIAGAGATAAAPLAATTLAPAAAGGASSIGALAPLSSTFPTVAQGGAQAALGGGNALAPSQLVQGAAATSAANPAALTPMSSYSALSGELPALTAPTGQGLSLSDVLRGANLARSFLPGSSSGGNRRQGPAAAPGAVGFPNRGPAQSPNPPPISSPASIFRSPWAPFR